MPEPVSHAVALAAGLLAAGVGMGWLALSMPVHAMQVWAAPVPPAALRRLRPCAAAALALALACCLAADHASMAVLVWVMSLAGAALATAFALAWRPRWLRGLAPWVRAGAPATPPTASR